jgi:transcriptional regulator GlxA family with amidase domain
MPCLQHRSWAAAGKVAVMTGETVDAVAERAGFGNAATLRHHFRAWRHTTPHAYRRAFRPAAGGRAA